MNAKSTRVDFSNNFKKQLKRAPLKIKEAFQNRLLLFGENTHHAILNNHALAGDYSGYRSINVTGDWRAIFSVLETDTEKVIVFEVLGTHSQLYK